jgi:RND family efflux transporter MFP subunit
VRTIEAQLDDIQSWVLAEGTVRSVRREYLTFSNAGRVIFIKPGVDGDDLREGAQVEVGELLAYQDQRQYQADIATAEATVREAKTQAEVAKASLIQARADYQLAQRTLARYQELRQRQAVSERDYDEVVAKAESAEAAVEQAKSQVQAAQAQVDSAQARLDQTQVDLEDTELRSPINGIVAYLNIEEGMYFMPSVVRTDSEAAALQTVPMVIIDPSRYEVTINIPAYERGRIEVGQPALIEPDNKGLEAADLPILDAPSPEFITDQFPVRGEVFSINPAVNPGGRSIQIKIRTTAGAERLQDGMFVTAWIAAEQRDDVVVAPLNAFVYRDNRPFVYVVDPQTGAVAARAVKLGLGGFTQQEILTGVEVGEQLVTDGRFQLSDGVRVEVLEAEPASATSNTTAGDPQ